MFSASRTVTTAFSGDSSRYYSTELGLPNPGNQPGYPVINNIGVGTGRRQLLPADQLEHAVFQLLHSGKQRHQGEGQARVPIWNSPAHDQLTYMPQQQRTAGSVTFQANATALYDRLEQCDQPRGRPEYRQCGGVNLSRIRDLRGSSAKGKYYMRQNEDSMYFQDNWRATQRLTVNLGIRWQFSPYPTDKYNIFSSFDRKNMAIVLGQPLDFFYKIGAANPALVKILESNGAKFVTAEQAGLPKKLVHDNWFNIGPTWGSRIARLTAIRVSCSAAGSAPTTT
jgi:hypothetical protein